MKKLLLAIVMAFTRSAVSFAQTAAEVNATQKKMMAASTPCNGAPEAFKTFIAQFSTDKDFMESRITLTADQREKYADLLVPADFVAKTPFDKDGEEYYQAWGELQYNKVYLCCGWVDSYDTHTFEFTRGEGGKWFLSKIVPGE